jgi:hypothetical protein
VPLQFVVPVRAVPLLASGADPIRHLQLEAQESDIPAKARLLIATLLGLAVVIMTVGVGMGVLLVVAMLLKAFRSIPAPFSMSFVLPV